MREKYPQMHANRREWYAVVFTGHRDFVCNHRKTVTTDTRSVTDFFASSAPSRLCVGFYRLNDSGISVLITLVNPELVEQLLVMVFIRVIGGQQFFAVENGVRAGEKTQRLFFIAHFGAAG